MKDPAAWVGATALSNDGIVRRADGRFAIGTVLLIESDVGAGEVVVVTKAQKPGYEFSGLDALPGGLLRPTDDCVFRRTEGSVIGQEDLRRIMIESISARATAEAGFLLQVAPVPIQLSPPPMTAYTVSGSRHYVVVLPHVIKASRNFHPVASDRSITSARWAKPVDVVQNLAPANCIIICAFFWCRLDSAEREKCRHSIDKAAVACKRWAQDVGMPPVDMTWLS